jgi:SAM-dependent methyltransferase
MKTRKIFRFKFPSLSIIYSGFVINKLRAGIILSGLMVALALQTTAQNLDVPYVPTPNDVVEQMLDLANVGAGDYVIDLGSGDGRIVIAAVKRGAVGHGIDLYPERIKEAKANAEEEGVSDRVMFMQGDIFETDFSDASVITLYLLSSVNEKLRPSLLEELSPGTRVVSHSFSMGDWQPDNQIRYANRTLYFWVIPADVEGSWEWQLNGDSFDMDTEQTFQEVDVTTRNGNREMTVQEAVLKGDRLNLILNDDQANTRYIYSGVVEGDTINGTVQIHTEDSQSIEEWSATRDAQ